MKKILSLLLSLVMLLTITAGLDFSSYANDSCTRTYNGHTYRIINIGMTWDDANDYCKKINGHLVTITNDKENNFISTMVNALPSGRANWIGGYFDGKIWKWVNNEKWNYTNWAPGEPNNYLNRSEDKLLIENGKWNDQKNSGDPTGIGIDEMSFICEWDYLLDSNVCLSSVELIEFERYSGNEGDSNIFILGEQNERNGNIGLNGEIYKNGIDTWLARWNYKNEISWVKGTYKLSSKFKNLTGKIGLIKDTKNNNGYNYINFDITIYFYNKEKLLKSYSVNNNSYNKDININVSAVDELTILVKDNKAVSGGTSLALYNMFFDSPQSLNFNQYFSNNIVNNYNYINSTEGPAGPLMDDAWDINKLANGFVQSISHFGNGKSTEENIQEYYDAVLYDLISNTYSMPNFDSYMQKRFKKLRNEMIDYFIGKGLKLTDTVKTPDLGTFYNYVQEFIGANQNNYELTYDVVKAVVNGYRDGNECIEKLCQYMVLKEEGVKLEGALKLMAQNAENGTLKKAINDVINSISMTPQEYMNYVVADKMKEYGVSTIEKVATKIFEEIIVKGFNKVFPFAEIKLIADITNCLTETFFATTTNSNQQYRIYLYIQIEKSCKKSIASAKNTYQNNKSENNAATLVSCYDMYLRIYEHEIAECLNFADIYYNQGVFNKVKNKLFNNGKNYQSAVDWINSYNYDLEQLKELEQTSYEKWGLEKGIIKKVYVIVLVNNTVAFYNDYNVNTGSTFNIPSMQGVINTLKKSTGYDVVTNGNYYDKQLKNKIIGGSFKVNKNTAVFVDMDLVKKKLTKATTSKDGNIITIDALTNKQLYKTVIPKVNNIKLSNSSYTYSGKMITPKVTVKNSKGYVLREGSDYKLTYSSGRKKVGKYSVKITFKGNYSGSKTLTYTILPKSTTLSKVTAGKKAFTVKWKKQTSQTTGYQIQYSTSSKFKGAKTVTITKNKTTSKKISKLKSKKKYYVRVRTYKTVKVNGKNTKIYSSWSKVKTVKTK